MARCYRCCGVPHTVAPGGGSLGRRDGNVAIMAPWRPHRQFTQLPGPSSGTIPSHGPVTRPNMVSVGTIVWLASELMFFAGLFAMYFTIRSVAPDLWAEQTEKLNIPFATVNTPGPRDLLGVVPARRVRGRARPAGAHRLAAGRSASGACASGTS